MFKFFNPVFYYDYLELYIFYFLEYGSYKIKCSNNDILDIGPNPMAFNAKPIENGDAISKYATFYMPKYGMFYGIVMDISQQTTFCLSFNTVSSEELSKLILQSKIFWLPL